MVLVLVLVLRPRVLVLVFVLTKKSYLHHCLLVRERDIGRERRREGGEGREGKKCVVFLFV